MYTVLARIKTKYTGIFILFYRKHLLSLEINVGVNYYVRDPAGTSIPVSLKMKQDSWPSIPRSPTFVADLWPATSVGTAHLVLPVLQRIP